MLHLMKLTSLKKNPKGKKIIKTIKKPILYLNCVGTQDDLLFDGGSFILVKIQSY